MGWAGPCPHEARLEMIVNEPTKFNASMLEVVRPVVVSKPAATASRTGERKRWCQGSPPLAATADRQYRRTIG